MVAMLCLTNGRVPVLQYLGRCDCRSSRSVGFGALGLESGPCGGLCLLCTVRRMIPHPVALSAAEVWCILLLGDDYFLFTYLGQRGSVMSGLTVVSLMSACSGQCPTNSAVWPGARTEGAGRLSSLKKCEKIV